MTWVLHYTNSLLTKITKFQQPPGFAGGPRWVGVGFVASPPSQQRKEHGKQTEMCWKPGFSSLLHLCFRAACSPTWVGLMSWQDFLLPAVIPQRGFDGVQKALLFPFPSEAGRHCFPSRGVSNGWLSGSGSRGTFSTMTQACVGILVPLLN